MFGYYMLCIVALIFAGAGGHHIYLDIIKLCDGQTFIPNILAYLSFTWIYIFGVLVNNKSLFKKGAISDE